MASAMQPDKKVKEAIFRICYVIAALMFCGEVAFYVWLSEGVAFAGAKATALFAFAILKALSFIVFVRGAVNLQFPEFEVGRAMRGAEWEFTSLLAVAKKGVCTT